MVPPHAEELLHAAKAIQNQMSNTSEPILVCCALGYSLSIAVIITWLVHYQYCASLDEALSLVKSIRPQMVLSKSVQQLISKAVMR